MSEDRDKLKSLLLSEELAQLKTIQKLLDDQKQFALKISNVLNQATDLAIEKDPNYKKKLAKIDSKAFVRAIRTNKQTFINALLPIIGPMIRQSVTNAIRRFVADVNRAMELGFSKKALKWRWQSMRTGIPFAELVFNNTIAYQVQHVFLIDNHTGLLIEYAGHENTLLQDKEAMSAMLTAIQDFVKDSINNKSEGLSAAEMGNQLVWVIQDSQANLAVVVKGAPTNRLREKLTAASEELHADYRDELACQDKWNNNPELKLQLEQLLLTKSLSEENDHKRKINFWPWLIIIFGLISWFSWQVYVQHNQYNDYYNQLHQTPGLVLQELTKEGDSFIAKGLLDPLTDTSHIDEKIQLQTTPYISLEDPLIRKRVEQFLVNYELQIQVKNGIVTITGEDPEDYQLNSKLTNLNLVAGVQSIVNHMITVSPEIAMDQQLAQFIANHPVPNGVSLKIIDDTVVISGTHGTTNGTRYLRQLNNSIQSVDSSSFELLSKDDLIQLISQSHINLIQTEFMSEQQINQLSQVFQYFQWLNNEDQLVKLELIGRSDCQGSIEESNNNIKKRVNLVREQLIGLGLPAEKLISETPMCDHISNQVNLSQLGVWFGVKE